MRAGFKSLIPNLNEDQLKAITHVNGPMIIIAGPGAGKTPTLVLRARSIILSRKADPKEIMLTTFTEKAAFEKSSIGCARVARRFCLNKE